MSYLGEIGLHSAAWTAAHSSARATPVHSHVQGIRQRSKHKNDMNYEVIETRIKALIKAAEKKPLTRVDATLEPIRESLLEARRQGVRLRDLYDAVKAESKDISPSSFAKYAQRHLQVKKQREKPSVRQSLPKQKSVEAKFQEEPKQPRTQTGKPRIATGDY